MNPLPTVTSYKAPLPYPSPSTYAWALDHAAQVKAAIASGAVAPSDKPPIRPDAYLPPVKHRHPTGRPARRSLPTPPLAPNVPESGGSGDAQ